MTSEKNWFEEILIIDSSTVVKTNLEKALFSNKFCGLCLTEAVEFTSVYTELEIFGDFGICNLTIEGIINYVFKDKIAQNMAQSHICTKCLRQVYESYLFLRNTNYKMKVLSEYVTTLDRRVSEVNDTENLEKLVIALHHQDTDRETVKFDQEEIHVDSGFKCSKCNLVVLPFELFKTHNSGHNWKSKKQCEYCKETVFLRAYNEHLRSKHGDEVYSCNICFKGFKGKNDYKRHIKRVHDTCTNEIEIVITQIKSENENQCQLCFKDLDEITLKTHKCKYSCPDCDIYKCIHFDYLLSCLTQMMKRTKFSCPEESCDYICSKRRDFVAHLNKEHLNYHPFTCDICKQQFYSKHCLKRHIITYHQEDYICQYCDKDFSVTKHLYRSHEKDCKAVVREFKCVKCVASFAKSTELERHNLKGCRNLPCPLCNWKFSEQSRLSEHKTKVHSGIQMVQRFGTPKECPVCNQVFFTNGQLHIHFQTHGVITKWTCKICNGTFPTRTKLSLHKSKAHKQVQCQLCHKKYSKSAMGRHLYEHRHVDRTKIIRTFSCDICGEVKKSKKSFDAHYSVHTKQVKCPECSRLIHEGRLKHHLAYHKKQKELKANNMLYRKLCEQCDFRALSKDVLEAHVNQMHLKIRPYACSICEKSFCGKIDLHRHMECHTRKNQLTCEICNASLINKRSYNKHMAKHTGNKPFKCDLCPESYVTITQLKQHKKEKHSDTVVPCPVTNCTAKFSSNRLLKHHVRQVHWKRTDKPMDPSQIEGLPKGFYSLFEDHRRRKIEVDDS